jgi:transposase-like protein
MTSRKRRSHSPELKARVVLAAVQGDKMLAELAVTRPSQVWATAGRTSRCAAALSN